MNDSKSDVAVSLPRTDLLHAAYALLTAAIPALRNRVDASLYQDAFCLLPEDVQAEARRLMLADPDIDVARARGVEWGGKP